MKKGKIFGKRHILLAVMVAALALAVWLNMKYASTGPGSPVSTASTDTKYLGEATYVSNDEKDGAVQTAAGASEDLESARKERNQTRQQTIDSLKTTINDANLDDAQKNIALDQIGKIAGFIDQEAAVETVLKSKGFDGVLAVISADNATVLVAKDNLLASETMQIQDAVIAQTGMSLSKINIITVK